MRRTILTAGAAILAVAGGGAALASTTLGSREEQSRAVIEDTARNLGVTPVELSDALKDALGNRVDEAVDAGRLTEEQGEELKERIESQDYPPLGGFGLGHHGARGGHGFGHFEEAAAYLGMTEDELRDELAEGKTLAEVAEDEGKSVEGLVSALVADETKAIAQAVLDGRLTQAQADRILETAKARATDLVNGEPSGRDHHGLGGPRGAFPAGPHHRGDPM
jgi:AraC-like DNA-binding protein